MDLNVSLSGLLGLYAEDNGLIVLEPVSMKVKWFDALNRADSTQGLIPDCLA